MDFGEIWTWILAFLASIIIPVWNDLIQYLPVLLLVLVVFSALGLLAYWRRNAHLNSPRVPKPQPMGRKPEELHLPGPSLWPFVGPVGLVLMLGALAFGAIQPLASVVLILAAIIGTPITELLVAVGIVDHSIAIPAPEFEEAGGSLGALGVFGLGLGISVIGVIGWYLEAKEEYVEVEAGGHGHAQLTAGSVSPPDWALEPPEGVHLPGPSAWPFLAPVGLFFLVSGLVFGPILIIGGLIMAGIAAIGWMRDADRELEDIEEHGHAPPADRDPEKAWPKALMPIYLGVGAFVVLFTLTPWLLTFLPGTVDEDPFRGPPPVDQPFVSASTVTEFDVTEISTFADRPFTIEFANEQVGVPHNVAIYESSAQEVEFFLGEIFDGPETRIYEVGPLTPGEYFYVCSVHPPMIGTLYVVS